MNLGFFLPSGTKGGAEYIFLQLILEYQNRGHKTVIFFLTKKNVDSFILDIDNNKSIIYICPVNRELYGYFFLPFFCFFHTLKYKKFSLVFSTHVHLNSLVALYRKFYLINSASHVARESTLIFKRFIGIKLLMFKFFYHFGYRFIPNIICQTELMKDELVKNLPWLSNFSNILVMTNPINLTEIKIKSILPFDKPPFEYIVAAGSLTYVKGFDILIKSFKNCLLKFPELKLLILGEGIIRKDLENLIKLLQISESVLLLGWQNNVYPFFKYSKVCVVSSRIEGFPNVLLQEMACNNSVVSTLCAGGIENIPGIYYCQTECVDQLANSIIKAIETNNNENRILFDRYLEQNSVKNYVSKLNKLNIVEPEF